ncbi:biotin carboxylase N-terminal domain-containing protein [Nocardia sp. NPDC087230]|uniref:ATP-binding protein n=1 Tax=Nocardia sp. NPDC087230 TaxID=3364331 RepID=UPI00380EC54B
MTGGAITNVLVANRGEIARRVFATCRRMGIGTTAVYSDADAAAPHVAEADAAIRLPGNTPAETYLRGELIIEAALSAGADAIHPGYGFLSENAEFARSVLDAGLVWIGPPVAAIEQMGSKVESKKMMDAAGVPVLAELDPAEVTEAHLPVLIKASAGGGGRGMRVVRELGELKDQIAAAQREAESAFGDPTVFCERYLETGRHIEVQVMSDTFGTTWAVGERECSIQRRHQKVVEEAPSPLVEKIDALRAPGPEAVAERAAASSADGQSMRERLFEAARLAAEAIGYEGAGTVEFLADEKGEFFFLEMNTRLQVEHPVTEQTTGLDLVRLQLQVASGLPLPATQPAQRGHSIEVRLYAEDPAQDWQPQSGPVHKIEIPFTAGEFTVLEQAGVRLDTGVVDGSVVGVHYDPMLAKVISYAETRAEAAHLLATALQRAKIHGLVTNRDLLVRVLRHPAFLAGDTDTAFFATHDLAALSAPLVSEADEALSIVAAALADAALAHTTNRFAKLAPSGWRNLASQPQCKSYESRTSGTHEVRYRFTRAGGIEVDGHDGLELISVAPERVVLAVPGERGSVRRQFEIARYGDLVAVDSPLGPVAVRRLPRFTDPSEQVAAGSLLAPMPGSVIRLGAAEGDQVRQGQPILWLEAMKMEHTIVAPATGVLSALNVTVGQQVEVGTVLAVVEEEEQEPS